MLGKDFVQWQLDRLASAPGLTLPSLDAAWEGFQTLGHRPEELRPARSSCGLTSSPYMRKIAKCVLFGRQGAWVPPYPSNTDSPHVHRHT